MNIFGRSFAFVAAVVGSTALAEVTLELGDGSIILTGDITGTDNGEYQIQTAFGRFSVPIDLTTCIGDECPVFEEPIGTDLRIVSAAPFASTLLPDVVTSLVESTGSVLETPAAASGLPAGNIFDTDGNLLAVVDAKIGGASAAFQALLADEADIILTDRRISQSEIVSFLDAGLGDLTDPQFERIFGQDAATLVVSPVNPVQTLSLEQTAAIFSGEITNWSEVGGPDLPINVYAPAEGSAVSALFDDLVLFPNLASYSSRVDRNETATSLAQRVAGDPMGIGVTTFTRADAGRVLPITSACGIQNLPSPFSVASEDYPLASRFYAYTTNRPAPELVAQMADLMQTDQGQSAVANAGFVNLSTQSADLNSFGQRLAYALSSPTLRAEIPNLTGFAREVIDAERLSTTFRFDTGSSQLDNKALADVLRLADLLAQPQYSGAEVLLVGFTDSIGRTEVNTVLSQRRAQQVRDEVTTLAGDLLGGIQLTPLGFGAASPVACNTDNAGRELNRRVEVWLR